MSNLLFFQIVFLNIITLILSIEPSENFYVLSDTGEKGAVITSFTKNLYLISSAKTYNIINEKFIPLKIIKIMHKHKINFIKILK